MSIPDMERNRLDNQAAIDRLIDGSLSETERRELLQQIEVAPDGWRLCALAFLEDQAWRQALAGSTAIIARPNLEAPSVVISRPASYWRSGLLAATLLAATFGSGFGISRFTQSSPLQVSVQSQAPGAPAKPASTVPETIHEVGTIDLVDSENGQASVKQIPILAGPGLNDQWIREQPSSIPDHLRAQWLREGYQVQERRRVVSVILVDGRKVSIPVDEVALNYVGQNPL